MSTPTATAPSQQPDFQPDTASLDVTDASATGSQTLRLEIITDGNELTDAIGRSLTIAQSEGRV